MGNNIFDLDQELTTEINKKDYSTLLEKADALCMREEYDRALEIYKSILEEDFKNQEACLGILKVHSQYYTLYKGEDIEKDIRVIERMFPDITDKQYCSFILKRRETINKQNNELKKKEPKEKQTHQISSSKVPQFNLDEFEEMCDFYENNFEDEPSLVLEKCFPYFEQLYLGKIDVPMKYRLEAGQVVGFIYQDNGKKDLAFKAFKWVFDNRKKADCDIGMTCNQLGYIYFDDKKDFSKAKVAWLIGSEEYGDFDSARCLKVHFGL